MPHVDRRTGWWLLLCILFTGRQRRSSAFQFYIEGLGDPTASLYHRCVSVIIGNDWGHVHDEVYGSGSGPHLGRRPRARPTVWLVWVRALLERCFWWLSFVGVGYDLSRRTNIQNVCVAQRWYLWLNQGEWILHCCTYVPAVARWPVARPYDEPLLVTWFDVTLYWNGLMTNTWYIARAVARILHGCNCRSSSRPGQALRTTAPCESIHCRAVRGQLCTCLIRFSVFDFYWYWYEECESSDEVVLGGWRDDDWRESSLGFWGQNINDCTLVRGYCGGVYW